MFQNFARRRKAVSVGVSTSGRHIFGFQFVPVQCVQQPFFTDPSDRGLVGRTDDGDAAMAQCPDPLHQRTHAAAVIGIRSGALAPVGTGLERNQRELFGDDLPQIIVGVERTPDQNAVDLAAADHFEIALRFQKSRRQRGQQ
ncbi:hypothetical protein SDC9_198659 [bioreactor metagenome]|uniref:Uncharacterized protein n=1 Tax=bioreactor metagenome TaxID=1076179 RepID=A0A645II87_9ZZZZ